VCVFAFSHACVGVGVCARDGIHLCGAAGKIVVKHPHLCVCACVFVCMMCVCARDVIHLFAAIDKNVVKHTQFMYVSVLVRVHVRARVCVHVSLYILDRGYRLKICQTYKCVCVCVFACACLCVGV